MGKLKYFVIFVSIGILSLLFFVLRDAKVKQVDRRESSPESSRLLPTNLFSDQSYKENAKALGPSPVQRVQVRGTVDSIEKNILTIKGGFGFERFVVTGNSLLFCYPVESANVYLDFSRFRPSTPSAQAYDRNSTSSFSLSELSKRVEIGSQVVALEGKGIYREGTPLEYLIVYGCKE